MRPRRPDHPLWAYLSSSGADADELLWFADNPCPPDVIGVNYYVTSERWLDHRLDRYPRPHGGRRTADFVDIESVRVLATPSAGIGPLLDEAWERYRHPAGHHRGAHRRRRARTSCAGCSRSGAPPQARARPAPTSAP